MWIRKISFRTKHKIWLGVFILFAVLTFFYFPPFKLLSVLPTTEAYFHFLVNERLTNFSNGVVTSNISYAIGEGHIRLSGVGGLSVNNDLDLDVKMNIYRNSSAPNASIINNATSVIFHPG